MGKAGEGKFCCEDEFGLTPEGWGGPAKGKGQGRGKDIRTGVLHEWHRLSCQELEALMAGAIIEEELEARKVLGGSGNVSLTVACSHKEEVEWWSRVVSCP